MGGVIRRMARFQALRFWVVAGGAVAIVFALALVWLLRSAKHDELPPLAAGIAFRGGSLEPNPAFTRRLRARFPVGSNAAALTDELDREGFNVDPAQGKANFKSGKGWPCLNVLLVDWKLDARARIASVYGYFNYVCL
jgi:hypothetical protein